MAALPRQPRDAIAALRESLRSDRAALEQGFLKHNNAARLLAAHTRLIDRYLRRVWRQLAMPQHIALAAVGGYARQRLYPRSDIDLLILLDAESEKLLMEPLAIRPGEQTTLAKSLVMAGHPPDDALRQQLHELIGMLWDIGLEVGHSVRTVAQCIEESADITVQTNLLEARLLCGSKELFDELCDSMRQRLDLRAFYLAKLEEQQRRHARYAEADFNLEPNLKESPGGLRDLQTVTWIARAAGLGTHWSELAQIGLLTAAEARQVARHSALLATLRIRLHYLARRHEDRLLFDFQTPLAEQIGIRASANRRASEHLMQRYYRTKLAVRQFNAIMLQNLHDYLFGETPVRRILNERFRIVGTRLDIRDEQLFEHTPEAIFELFLLMEQHGELSDPSAGSMRRSAATR